MSSRNSMKHGLYAKNLPVEFHEIERIETWNASFLAVFGPTNDYERFIIEQITTASWKLNTILKVQRDMIVHAEDVDEIKAALERFDRHIVLAERSVARASRKLDDHRKAATESAEPNGSGQANPTPKPSGSTPNHDQPEVSGGAGAQLRDKGRIEETNPTTAGQKPNSANLTQSHEEPERQLNSGSKTEETNPAELAAASESANSLIETQPMSPNPTALTPIPRPTHRQHGSKPNRKKSKR